MHTCVFWWFDDLNDGTILKTIFALFSGVMPLTKQKLNNVIEMKDTAKFNKTIVLIILIIYQFICSILRWRQYIYKACDKNLSRLRDRLSPYKKSHLP